MIIKNNLSPKWKIWIGKQLFVIGLVFIFLGLLFLFNGQTDIFEIILLMIGIGLMILSIAIFRSNFEKWWKDRKLFD